MSVDDFLDWHKRYKKQQKRQQWERLMGLQGWGVVDNGDWVAGIEDGRVQYRISQELADSYFEISVVPPVYELDDLLEVGEEK